MKIYRESTNIKDTGIFEKVAKNLNVSESTVEQCFQTLIDWTNNKMVNMEVPAIRWNKFITFEMRAHKLKEEKTKELYRKYKEKDYEDFPRRYLNEQAYLQYRSSS